ncbi:uncharacterized protein LOC126564570 [Anopheles maculipalpis]|uniref:uncharacterized protein LOC126564570 n=1 Tax=Anopheles maculipalpis TaxID=1496333 RepID=UPI002158C8E8|nr:uncharacterized protein LOC126564570 [Anopheles maculipalpis]
MLPKSVLPVLLLLVGVLLQPSYADPSPDFGIKATITATTNIVRQIGTLNTAFDNVDDMSLTLSAGYTVLDDMKAAIIFIGSKVTAAGKVLTSALTTLAGDRSNDVNGAFAPVYNAIGALRTLLQTGFTAQFTTLQRQGIFITNQLTDSFKAILTRLTLISGALDRLKAGVTAARDAPGNPPNGISPDNLSRYVTSKMTFDLQDALSRLTSDLPLVQFIVEETQRKLSIADQFLGDMRIEAETVIGDTTNAEQRFESDVSTVSTSVVAALNERVKPSYNEQLQTIGTVQSKLEAIGTYTDDLKPALDRLAELLNEAGITARTIEIENAFTQYNNDLDGTIASVTAVERFFIDESCSGLVSVIDALVANSPYSNFCFSKFSPRLFTQYALSFYIVSECYDIETERIFRLQDLMSLIVGMIVYDVEDLGDAIITCALLTDGSNCVTTIGPYYEKLATTVDEKQAYMVNFILSETKFSLQRVSSCINKAKYSTVISVVAIVENLKTCSKNGPSIA